MAPVASLRLGLLMGALIMSPVACDQGPAIEANGQVITFSAAPSPDVDQTSLVVSATATSGLPVRYSSLTRAVCSVDGDTGLVTGLTSGTCTIAADQPGDEHYAPAAQASLSIVFRLTRETLAFAQVPSLGMFDRGTIAAVDSVGAKVTYASVTPTVCTVDSDTGLVNALSPGECTLVAVAGSLEVAQTIFVTPASFTTVPGAPTGVTVSAGDGEGAVIVHIGGTVSGGAPLTEYLIVSNPGGIIATSAASPIVVACPSSCAGRAFAASASNHLGTGDTSPWNDIVTEYEVIETFYEPDTQPNDTIFVGRFTLDATTGTVSDLRGALSEAMTGGSSAYPHDTMTWLELDHQLSTVAGAIDGADGVLVTAFRWPSTDTLSSSPELGGTDGFSPGTGMGRYYGYPGVNAGNAYARIFVNLSNPTAVPTRAQIDRLAYADCAPGGMMGATCMTGTAPAGYGRAGTMGGYPKAQSVFKR